MTRDCGLLTRHILPRRTDTRHATPLLTHVGRRGHTGTVHVHGDAHTVTAGPDGSATVMITPQFAGQFNIQVRSHSDNGWVSSVAYWFGFISTAPTITADIYPDYYGSGLGGGGVGIAGNFTFTSSLPDVVGFRYWIDWNESFTVPAGPDGTATVSWTPDTSGVHEIEVWAVDANDSFVSDLGTYGFLVNDPAAS